MTRSFSPACDRWRNVTIVCAIASICFGGCATMRGCSAPPVVMTMKAIATPAVDDTPRIIVRTVEKIVTIRPEQTLAAIGTILAFASGIVVLAWGVRLAGGNPAPFNPIGAGLLLASAFTFWFLSVFYRDYVEWIVGIGFFGCIVAGIMVGWSRLPQLERFFHRDFNRDGTIGPSNK